MLSISKKPSDKTIDLTFIAPKALSAVFAAGGAESYQIKRAHDAAVQAVTSRIVDGYSRITVETFDHTTSRNGGPCLHSHVILAGFEAYVFKDEKGKVLGVHNLASGADEPEGCGLFGTSGRPLIGKVKALGTAYRQELAELYNTDEAEAVLNDFKSLVISIGGSAQTACLAAEAFNK